MKICMNANIMKTQFVGKGGIGLNRAFKSRVVKKRRDREKGKGLIIGGVVSI